MKRIGKHGTFPETEIEARVWDPAWTYRALHSRVLVVAVTRIEGTWKAYCVPVPGDSHKHEWRLWETEGCALSEEDAIGLFGQDEFFHGIPYAR